MTKKISKQGKQIQVLIIGILNKLKECHGIKNTERGGGSGGRGHFNCGGQEGLLWRHDT